MKSKIVALLNLLACAALMASIVLVPGCGVPEPVETGPTPTRSQEPQISEPTAPPALETFYTTESPDTFSPDDMEATMLAKTMYGEANVLRWYGDKFGVSYQARQAAVAWVALNRVDAGGFGDDLYQVLTRPNQFAYDPGAPVTDELYELAWDVLHRWWAEKEGETDVGRTIPPEYLYFDGDGKENYFRIEYQGTGDVWDWSLPDPYKEDQ